MRGLLRMTGRQWCRVMVGGEGPPSTSFVAGISEDADADLRRHVRCLDVPARQKSRQIAAVLPIAAADTIRSPAPPPRLDLP